MYFHLILTDDCNLCCRYCRAKAFENEDVRVDAPKIEIDPDIPLEVAYRLGDLYRFLEKDPAPVVTFYGGEPLLRTDLVEEIITHAPARRFMIQTNGLLLDRLDSGVVNRFSTILVSLDGNEALTDAGRGSGVYRRVMTNVGKIVENGYMGELIARMTVTEETDILAAVRYLSDNPDHSFTSIHWQLDANFSGDFSRRKFAGWMKGSYNPGISGLVEYWVDTMESEKRVLRWYPFLDPVEDMLLGRESLLRCGSGYANYSIMTDGHIAPCPVMIGMSQYYVGHIRDADPCRLPQVPVGGECTSCTIRTFCGGRCLYSGITEPWDAAGRQLVCETVGHLQQSLETALPRIRDMIANGRIRLDDFSHEKFNGCEIIP